MKGPKPRTKLVHMPGTPRNMRFTVPMDDVEESPQVEVAESAEPPEWLDTDAQLIFQSRANEIDAAGYWQPRFADALALFASLMAEYQRSPAQASAAKITQMRLLMSELGLTPQSARGVIRTL